MNLDNLIKLKVYSMAGSWNVKTDEPPKEKGIDYPYVWKDIRDKVVAHSANVNATDRELMSQIMKAYKDYVWMAGFNADAKEEKLRLQKTHQPRLPGI